VFVVVRLNGFQCRGNGNGNGNGNGGRRASRRSSQDRHLKLEADRNAKNASNFLGRRRPAGRNSQPSKPPKTAFI
jgi:hypothetical protein